MTLSFEDTLPDTGYYCACFGKETPSERVEFYKSKTKLIAAMHGCNGTQVWVSYSSFKKPTKREQANSQALKSFVFDADVGREGEYSTQEEAWNAFSKVLTDTGLPMPTFVVNSGYGVHIWWTLPKEIAPDRWKPIALRLKALLKTADAKLANDTTRVADSAGLLRWPGTHNRKHGGDELVTVEYEGKLIDLDAFEALLPVAPLKNGHAPGSLLLKGPIPDRIRKRQAQRQVVLLKPEPEDPDMLRSALETIKDHAKGGPGTWYPVLQALYNAAYEGRLDDRDAFELADYFSSLAPNSYEGTDDVAKKWDDLKYRTDGDRISIRSIYKWAEDKGWHAKAPEQEKLSAPPGFHPPTEEEGDPFGDLRRDLLPILDDAGNLASYCVSEARYRTWHATTVKLKPYGKGAAEQFINTSSQLYAGMTIDLGLPHGAIDKHNRINHFLGFTVMEKPGDCQTLLSYIREVIASDNEVWYDYIIKYVAWLWQNKSTHPGVALVLRSEIEGTGKSTFGSVLTALFDPAVSMVEKSEQLTGRFNSAVQGKRVLISEEALYAANPAHNGPLKQLITGQTVRIEKKHKEGFETKNVTALVMFTNNLWAVPASMSARRYAVFDVPTFRVDDSAFWDPVHAAIANPDAIAALAHHLAQIDLTGWAPRKGIPQTPALAEQKIYSAGRDLNGYFYKCLERGDIYDPATGGSFLAINGWPNEQVKIKHETAHALVDVIVKFTKQGVTFDRLKSYMCAVLGAVNHRTGSARMLVLPPLAACRDSFEQNGSRTAIKWP